MNQLVVSFQPDSRGFNCITSIQVADLFEKEHKEVLKSIAKLIHKEELNGGIYSLISYSDSRKRDQSMYLLTESGFLLLLAHFNFRSKKQKETRNEILRLFQERGQRLISRNLQLENMVTKRKQPIVTNGYIPIEIGNTGEFTTKMVPKDEHSEEDLLEGGIMRRESQIGGLRKGINKAKARLKEIRNPLKLVK